MPENTTTEFMDVVQALLNEDQLFSLNERRINARENFIRPVRIVLYTNPKNLINGFTRDLSGTGVGLLHKNKVEKDEMALITINRTWDEPVIMKCKAAWCCEDENGWFKSGWIIVSVESAESLA